MNNRGRLLRKRARTGDSPGFYQLKSSMMTPEKTTRQSILEIAALRLKTVVAEADQDVTLKFKPETGVQGYIVLLQPSLPSIL